MSYLPFVQEVVKSIVEFPDEVEINEELDNHTRTFIIKCNKDDAGKVIGKSGRVVANIRCVVSAIASKSREKAFIKVVTE